MTESRLVRVFVSSTFRDFHWERELLAKQAFPELRRRCRDRFVEFVEVDLRWGITQEHAERGETLPICLAEIDRCRPSEAVFFLGLLGERYGWIPKAKHYNPAIVSAQPWLKEHIRRKSVTELEILHGVLRNPEMNHRAFFYFRSPLFAKRQWQSVAARYPDAVRSDFAPGYWEKRKQERLKRLIRARSADFTVREPYSDLAELAQWVVEDLWHAIDHTFPASAVPDALELENREHRVFRVNRARAYVERPGLFETLDAHAEGSGPPAFAVLGESGSGKSALLAAWLDRKEDRVLFYHFIGATAGSDRAASILHRLLETLRKREIVPPDSEIPRAPEAMAALLPEWLIAAADHGGGVVLIDALNQLATSYDRELWWWPKSWPENVRVVFSTLPCEALTEMGRRQWIKADGVLRVPPLRPDEKGSILRCYLQRFAKGEGLGPELEKRILAAPQTTNPLFLRTVLEELRVRAVYGNLTTRLDAMLLCNDTSGLFTHVLKSLEKEAEHPDLVHRALGLMGTARRGLSETEILQLLSAQDVPAENPVPHAYWSPFYLAIEESLINRDGQLGFFHDYLRQAVASEYLDEEREKDQANSRLGETVLAWNSGRFGDSLRHYGFQHGIFHLIRCGRFDDALALIHNSAHRDLAVETTGDPDGVYREIDLLRDDLARKNSKDLRTAAELTSLAMSEPKRLAWRLRDCIKEAGQGNDWARVAKILGGGSTLNHQLMLGLLALAHATDSPPAEFRTHMEQALRQVNNPAWDELAERLTNSPSVAQLDHYPRP